MSLRVGGVRIPLTDLHTVLRSTIAGTEAG